MSGLDFDLNALIDAKNPNAVKKERVIGHFWASEFGKCHRQVYYFYKHPREFQPERKRVFKIGDLIHEHIQGLLKAREGQFFKQIDNELGITVRDWQSDLYITGRIDTMITPLQGEPYLLELKSVNDQTFRKRLQIQLSHLYQTMLYLHAKNLKMGYIVYISKEDMQFKLFDVPYDRSVLDNILSEARYLYYCLKNDRLPPKKPKFEWECKLCIFADVCQQQENVALKKRLFPNRDFTKEEVKPDGLRS